MVRSLDSSLTAAAATAAAMPLMLLAWLMVLSPKGLEAAGLCHAASCLGPDCPQIECRRGNCSANGHCICSPCWTGVSCNQFNNDHYPEFVNQHETVSIPNSAMAGDTVIQLRTVDADLGSTCHSDINDCDCALVSYSIELGNDDHLFQIDEFSGRITLARPANNFGDLSFKLYVTVVNRQVADTVGGDIVGPKNYAIVMVTIGTGSKSLVAKDEETLLERHRRSPVSPVGNMTFTLLKTGQYNYTTVMYVGTKVHFQLQIQFPPGTMDLLVELFTPDNATTIMVVCNPQIVWVGQNIHFDQSQAQPVMDSLDGSLNYDRAILDFGNVTNSNSYSNSENDSMIIIEWDAVMIDANSTVNGSVYWVSAGAEYNSQNEIWIGQAGFTTIMDNFVPTTHPTFNVTAPSVVYLDSSAIFQIDMYIPIVVSDLSFEAFAPLNYTDAMSICTAMVAGVGKNFECLQFQNLTPSFQPSSTGATNERVTLNIGHAINKGMREATPPADSLISVAFAVHLPYNDTYVGQTMWLGATLEINTNQIWAGQIAVTVANVTTPPIMSVNPILSLTPLNSSNAPINMPVALELNLTLNNNSDTGYTVSVTAPPGFSVCRLEMLYQGVNNPCGTNSQPTRVSDNEITWNLGQILNTGIRSTSVDPQANVIQFEVIVIALNVSTNTINSVATISATVTSTQGTGMTNYTLLTITNSPANTITNQTVPLTNMTFAFGNDNVFINATTEILMDISLYPGVIYSPFIVEVSTPIYNNSNLFSICRMELTQVGRNLACLYQPTLNSSVQYNSMVNGTPNYRAVLDFGSACNVANPPNGTFLPTVNDSLQLSIAVRVENHPYLLTTSPTNWVGAGLTTGNGLLWLGAQSLTAKSGYADYGVNATPYVSFEGQNNLTGSMNETAPGSLAVFLVTIKLPPLSTADWVIMVDTGSDTDLTVCSIHVKEFGYGIPCLNKTIPMRSTTRPGGTGRQTGWLELYKLTNIGSQPVIRNDVFDNNTLVVEVLVQVSSGAVPGSFHEINISADYAMNGADVSANLSILVGGSTSLQLVPGAPMPGFSFNQTPVNVNATVSNSVNKGQTLILTSEITFPPNSQNDAVITFSVPSGAGVVDVVLYDVVHVGTNLPCLTKELIKGNVTASLFPYARDFGVINLGTVCHYPVDTSDPDNDKIRVEAIVTIVRNSSFSAPQTITVSSTLTINGSGDSVQKIDLLLTNDISTIEYISNEGIALANVILNVTNGTIVPLEPSDFYTVLADVVVPPNSSVFALVDFVLPVDQSAVMTVVEAHVVSFGCNLGSFGLPTEFTVTYNSTKSTSQNDTAYITLGKLTNTGNTYRANTYQPGDDSFRISLTVQMADSLTAIQDSYHQISFGAKVGIPMIFRNLTVKVIRTLSEVADLIINATVNGTLTYSTGSRIVVTGSLRHSNQSKAEGLNASLFFYLPKYIRFSSLVSTDFIGPTPVIVNMTDSNSFSLQFSHFYFTDIVTYTFTIDVIPMAPGTGSPADTSLGFESVTYIIYRTGHLNQSGTPFSSEMESLFLSVDLAAVQLCPPLPLGMQSKQIQDCQISGSNSPTPNWQPQNARPGSATGWKSGTRLGQFGQYIQVNFGNLTRVTAVALQNPTSFTEFVQQYQLYYSDDGINWVSGEVVNPAISPSSGPTVINNLTSPMDSVYIRLEILSSLPTSGMAEVQVEFMGCVTSSLSVTPTELCSIRKGWQQPTASVADFYSRGFLVANGVVYFCDSNPSDGEVDCFSSADGVTWEALDKSVINVNGYLPSTNQLYGIDWNQRAFMVSEDQGATWMSVSSQRYQWAKGQSGYLAAINVPWIKDAALSSANPQSPYTDPTAKWGALYPGLYYAGSPGSWKQVADWMQCCP